MKCGAQVRTNLRIRAMCEFLKGGYLGKSRSILTIRERFGLPKGCYIGKFRERLGIIASSGLRTGGYLGKFRTNIIIRERFGLVRERCLGKFRFGLLKRGHLGTPYVICERYINSSIYNRNIVTVILARRACSKMFYCLESGLGALVATIPLCPSMRVPLMIFDGAS